MLHSVVRLVWGESIGGTPERMCGERIDPRARHLVPPPSSTTTGKSERWTRRRLLIRLASALGAAVVLPPSLAPVVPTEAR